MRNAGITFGIKEQWLLVLPQTLMRMHAGAIVTEHRFRHECHRLAMLASYILGDIFVEHHVVCCLHQRVETDIDFSLTSGTDFMMLCFNRHTEFLKLEHHLGANIL